MKAPFWKHLLPFIRIPIISYHFGAKNKVRVSQDIRYGLIYVSVIMSIGMILLQLFARQIVGIFSVTEKSRQLCVLALPLAWALSLTENAANLVWRSLPAAEA